MQGATSSSCLSRASRSDLGPQLLDFVVTLRVDYFTPRAVQVVNSARSIGFVRAAAHEAEEEPSE
eukprot:1470173-Pleurochrysis_carterae.AAC.1